MAPKKSVTPGVAEVKFLSGIPTGKDVSAVDRVNALFGASLSEDVYDGWASQQFSRELRLHSASTSPASTTFHLTVAPHHCNRLQNMHGGCTATLFDACTTSALAPIAAPGFWAYAGVTRTLNVTYIQPVPVGLEVEIVSTVVSAGKRMAVIAGVMRERVAGGEEGEGRVLAICEHGKVSIDPVVKL